MRSALPEPGSAVIPAVFAHGGAHWWESVVLLAPLAVVLAAIVGFALRGRRDRGADVARADTAERETEARLG